MVRPSASLAVVTAPFAIVAESVTTAVPSNGTTGAVTSPDNGKFYAFYSAVAAALPLMLPVMVFENVHDPLIVVAPVLSAVHTGSVS